jgi:hypothetical protein
MPINSLSTIIITIIKPQIYQISLIIIIPLTVYNLNYAKGQGFKIINPGDYSSSSSFLKVALALLR